jgi:hypothetical protein
LIQELIMEGGDAMAGALVGCWVGYMAIPSKWTLRIQNRQWLLEKTAGLCQALGVSKGPPEYKGSNDLDTRIDGGRKPFIVPKLLGEEDDDMKDDDE